MRPVTLAVAASFAAVNPSAAQQTAGVSIPISADVTPACTLSTPTAKAVVKNGGVQGGGTVIVEVGLKCAAGTAYEVKAFGQYISGSSWALRGQSLGVPNAPTVEIPFDVYWGRTQDRRIPIGQAISDVDDGSNAPKALLLVMGRASGAASFKGSLTVSISY